MNQQAKSQPGEGSQGTIKEGKIDSRGRIETAASFAAIDYYL